MYKSGRITVTEPAQPSARQARCSEQQVLQAAGFAAAGSASAPHS
jgi:hypothetical protein